MSDDHERIYLQDVNNAGPEGRTWCYSRIDDVDTEYVRADLFATLESEVEELRQKVSHVERDAKDAIVHIRKEHKQESDDCHCEWCTSEFAYVD